jgi:osmotically-inducible protein OsmY
MKIVGRVPVALSRIAGWAIFLSLLLGAPSCRSTGVTSQDATLQEEIADSLHRDHLDTIMVTVREARVTLSGVVSSEADRMLARRDAEQVEGVKAVVNNVRVGT